MEVSHIEIAKLELQRGDVLLVRAPPDWSDQMRHRAYEAVHQATQQAGITVPILIGGTDVEISIIRKDDAA